MKTMEKLQLIAHKSKNVKDFKFNSLAHLINEESLAICFQELKDNMSFDTEKKVLEAYHKNLAENLVLLVEKMKRKKYLPQSIKKLYSQDQHPLQRQKNKIFSPEDSIIQMMIHKILKVVFEEDFFYFSYGLRSESRSVKIVANLDATLQKTVSNFVIDLKIENLYDDDAKKWLLKCLEERINDPNFLGLVKLILKAGVWENEENSKYIGQKNERRFIGPLLTDIYLHYILDSWFERECRHKSNGDIDILRSGYNFVVYCEKKIDITVFIEELELRLMKFNLALSKEKKTVIKAGKEIKYLYKDENNSLNF